jgi:muramidase (phage lysozyme)
MRIKDGDYVGGLLSFGSAIPVAGWAFLALDIAREFMGGQEFDKSVGRAFGGKPGLTDKQVQKRTPHMSGPSFMGVASGGTAKGQKRRTLNTKRGKYKRKLAPRKPGQIQMQPGADVGGEDKLFGLFPNPLKAAQNAIDKMNPFKVIENTGKQLGKSDYFGPILAITSKILLGQKPSQKDYENVGLGINLLVSKGLNEGQLKGGLASAFAEGGLVDPKALDAISQGGDITNWVAKAFKESTESNTKETLRDIQDNLALKSSETQRKDDRIDPDQPVDTQDGEGGFSTNSGDYKELLDLISSKESAGAGYNAYNEGGAGGGYQVVGYGGDSRKGPLRRALTDMTIKEIMAHQKNVNPPIHAAGRYQIIGDTLAALIRGNYGPTGVNVNDTFTPDVQDKLGIALIKYRLKTGATPENFINEWRGLKFVNRTKLESAISKAQRGKTYRIDTQKNIAGMDTRLTGGAGLKQYITGDHTDRKHYAADHDSIAGKIDNYHDHLAFADRKTAQSAFNFFSKKFKVTDFLGYDYSASELARRHGGPDHPAGLAFDIPGSQWGGTPGTSSGSKEWAGSAKVRSALNQFLAGSSNSNSTIAKAYAKGGETLGGPHLAMLGEKGSEIVVDADSSGPARDMLLAINQAKDHRGVMKAIQQYAPYDALSPQTIVMPSSDGESDYDSEMAGGGVMVMNGGEGDSYDPFDALEMGG